MFKFWCFSPAALSITKSHYVRDCNLSIPLKRLIVAFYLQPTSLLSSNSHICSTHPGHPQSHHKETTPHICSVCFVELGKNDSQVVCWNRETSWTSDKGKDTPHLKGEHSKTHGVKMDDFSVVFHWWLTKFVQRKTMNWFLVDKNFTPDRLNTLGAQVMWGSRTWSMWMLRMTRSYLIFFLACVGSYLYQVVCLENLWTCWLVLFAH